MPQASSGSSGWAVALIVIGLLILVPSGLCTTVLGLSSSSWNDLGVVLTVGGPFVLVGGWMVFSGIRRLRRADEAPSKERSPS